MNVSDFQKYLRSLADAIGAAKGPNKELADAASALEPFGHHSMADFAKFLKLAEETYGRDGSLPVKTTPHPKPEKVAAEQLTAAMQAIRARLANGEPFTRAAVGAELAKFEGLTKPALVKVVKDLGYKETPKTKSDAIEWIANRLTAGTIAGARAGV